MVSSFSIALSATGEFSMQRSLVQSYYSDVEPLVKRSDNDSEIIEFDIDEDFDSQLEASK